MPLNLPTPAGTKDRIPAHPNRPANRALRPAVKQPPPLHPAFATPAAVAATAPHVNNPIQDVRNAAHHIFGGTPDTSKHDLGTFSATAYGPPWGGIQGTGTTSRGTNLHDGKRRYIIAVDPSVIPLGSKVFIQPNPYNYSGPFLADDTGGAIKGKRIDFYIAEGRAAQNRWGRRDVKISLSGETPQLTSGLPGGNTTDQAVNAATGALSGAVNGVGDFLSKLGEIFTADFWLRIGKILFGAFILFIGLFMMMKGGDVVKNATRVAKVAAKTIK